MFGEFTSFFVAHPLAVTRPSENIRSICWGSDSILFYQRGQSRSNSVCPGLSWSRIASDGYEWMDGLDGIRVVVGIEHLTVLIRSRKKKTTPVILKT